MITHLRCPYTRQELITAPETLVADLLTRRESLRNRDEEIPEPFTGGLTTLDGQWFYPQRASILVLLPGEAIALPSRTALSPVTSATAHPASRAAEAELDRAPRV
jgi:hypothetical protein